MKVSKIIKKLASDPDSQGELRRVARALGNELPRGRLTVLQSFRAQLAKQRFAVDWAQGYAACMRDVTHEYEVAIRHADDDAAVRSLIQRRDSREVLCALRGGARLPSDIARELSRDRASVSRTLASLGAAGLVRVYATDADDGRTRPHRLTLAGERAVERILETEGMRERVHADAAHVHGEFERGMVLAMHMLGHLVRNVTAAAPAIEEIAREFLGDREAASSATEVWTEAARSAGLLAEVNTERGESLRITASPSDRRREALWDNIPALVRQLRQYTRHDIPLYVRTGDAWDAWSDALRSEAPGPAHAVVRGRKPSHTEPPGRRYAMVYDDLDMLDDDRHEPSMEPVIRAADGRFVVTADGDDVPDGFVPLELSMPGASEGGSEEG